MKKKCLFLTAAAMALASCSGSGSSDVKVDDKIWTSYSTSKVTQNADRNSDFVDTGSTFKLEMMRDEYESSQIIVTASRKTTFDLEASELTDSSTGKTIPVSNITVYVQKYLTIPKNIHSTSVQYFYAGDAIPDMLLPMEYCKRSGENVMAANTNQGFSVEIDSNGLAAGHYTGNFTITLNGKTSEIPVEVTIWDIAMEGKSSFQSCWLIYSMYMLTGEYDASENMLDTYADFLSRYKANPYIIQPEGMNSPEAFMQDVERLWQIKNYNSIIIPYDFPLGYLAESDQGTRAASYIVKLAEKSTEENFYLDNALFYPSTYDEADAIETKAYYSPAFFREGGEYQKTLEKAIRILESEGYFEDHDTAWNERVKKAIRAIPDVFTNVKYMEDWVKTWPAVYCPQINNFGSQVHQEVYKDYAAKNVNGDLWSYTCCIPVYPYPSHHLDDDCLSMRTMGWMQKSYGINGYLYFMANMYNTENDFSSYESPYTTMHKNPSANGDGIIMYPGRQYGSSEPFPSMRLVTYRDGLEDYDMLDIYESKIRSAAEEYGITDFDFSSYVNDLYRTLFHASVNIENHDSMFEARRKLAERILNFDNEDSLFTLVKNENAAKVLHVYTTSPTLTVDGTSVTGTEMTEGHYDYSVSLGAVSSTMKLLTASGNTYSFENPGYRNLTNFSVSSSNVKVSEDSSVSYENGAADVIVRSVQKAEEQQTLRFTPKIRITDVGGIGGASELSFDYDNTSETEDFQYTLRLSTSDGDVTEVGGHFCFAGKSKNITVDLTNSGVNLSKVDEIILSFVNYSFDNNSQIVLLNDRDIRIHDLIVRY